MLQASRTHLRSIRRDPGEKEPPIDRTSRAGRWAAGDSGRCAGTSPDGDLGRPLVRASRLACAIFTMPRSWYGRSIRPRRFATFIRSNGRPIPNWAGPLALAGLVAILPAWVADRIMTSLTLVSFAASVFWLRWRVAGTRGLRVAALAGHAPCHEHGLDLWFCQLHARGVPVPDHPRALVAGARPFERLSF